MEVTHNQLKKLVIKSLDKNIPLMIYGSMGLGKSMVISETTESYAEKHGKEFRNWNLMPEEHKQKALKAANLSNYMFLIDMRLSQKDPSDMSGIPFVKDDHMKWFPPSVIKLMSNPTCNAVLFFDELSDASVPVMKAAYQLVLDRCSGEISFSDNVRVLAAGNRSVDKCGVNDTPKALDNRFMNVELMPPTAEDWAKWAMTSGVDNRITSFIMMSPSHLSTPVKAIVSKSFSTPRSVATLSKMIEGETDLDYINIAACASCGDGFGTDFSAYIANSKDVDPVELCKDPKKFNQLSLGARWFSLSALASYYKANGNKVVSGIVDVMLEADPDMAYVLYFMNRSANKLFPTQMEKIPQGIDLYNEFAKYTLTED